jgi:hypothetical protein
MATPYILFTLGSHIQFGSLDFLYIEVDYNLVLLLPSTNINAISKALSSLRLYIDDGQAPENDWLGDSRGGLTWAGKPHDHGKARGQPPTALHFSLYAGEIPTNLPTHHAQPIAKSS